MPARLGKFPLLLLLLPLRLSAWAADGRLPEWLTLALGMEVAEVSADERYGEGLVPTPQQPQQLVRGRHWTAVLKLRGAASDGSGKALWAHWKPALLQRGWTVTGERDQSPFGASIRLGQGRRPGPASRSSMRTTSASSSWRWARTACAWH